MTSLPHDPPPVEPDLLQRRLDHIRQALAARTLAMARRLSLGHRGTASPFEMLAAAHQGATEPAAGAVPVPPELIHRLMIGSGVVDWRRGESAPPAPNLLERWRARRMAGWSLPDGRRPSIYFVAIWGEGPDPGSRREETARLGLEALARALAPPDWLPLKRPRAAPWTERLPLPLVGHSAVATRLRRSYERLRDTPGPVMVVGPAERGALQVAAGLLGVESAPPPREVETLGQANQTSGLWNCGRLPSTSSQVQARVFEQLQSGVQERRRWVFLSGDGMREAVRRGVLRADLYWMLASRQLLLPPLSLRREDLPELVRECWQRHGGGSVDVPGQVAKALREAAWAGDLSQVDAEIRRLVCEHPGARRLRRSWFRRQLLLPLESSPSSTQSLDEAVAEVERRLLERALSVSRGNKAEAARMLRMSRTGLYRKMRTHGLLPLAAECEEGDEKGEPR